ncbi:alpha/beta fold hydrolase [Dyadobacter tibetensis]|uniref:alpha/beta fold hydrolase n=1 Tax=Dyadobacter tibetensis TaxID=1211851 RepID=UPI00047231E6|nr:alpha/beta hydrolase [Dyadobacter tibetensis]
MFYRHFLLLLVFFSSFSCYSCFRSYIITEKDVRKHYAHKPVRPTNTIIKNDTLSLGLASVGADTLPMLLLIHGAPGSCWGYMNIMDDPELSKRFHIVSVDRLGYGKSRMKKIKTVTSIETHARALLPILEMNKSGRKITVLGRSYGAPIAATLVSLMPDHFKELIMVSPVIDPEREKFYWFSKWGRMSVIQWFLPTSFNAATAEKYSHADELKKILPVWERLSIPTTVIQGGNDWISDPANIDFAKKHIKVKKAQFILLNNAGHMITYTHMAMIKEMLMKNALFSDRLSILAPQDLSVTDSK